MKSPKNVNMTSKMIACIVRLPTSRKKVVKKLKNGEFHAAWMSVLMGKPLSPAKETSSSMRRG